MTITTSINDIVGMKTMTTINMVITKGTMMAMNMIKTTTIMTRFIHHQTIGLRPRKVAIKEVMDHIMAAPINTTDIPAKDLKAERRKIAMMETRESKIMGIIMEEAKMVDIQVEDLKVEEMRIAMMTTKKVKEKTAVTITGEVKAETVKIKVATTKAMGATVDTEMTIVRTCHRQRNTNPLPQSYAIRPQKSPQSPITLPLKSLPSHIIRLSRSLLCHTTLPSKLHQSLTTLLSKLLLFHITLPSRLRRFLTIPLSKLSPSRIIPPSKLHRCRIILPR